ncbi:hypothetical protein AeRB84_004487 [Aphanomyces euteiches]|nr:hypothetical protein AeRB84_004487 [Aphanomyces euteiches]
MRQRPTAVESQQLHKSPDPTSMTSTEDTPLVTSTQQPAKERPLATILGAVAAVALTGLLFYNVSQPLPTDTHRHNATTAIMDDGSYYCDPAAHEFGYVKLPHKTNGHYFYSFFESRSNPETDPLVLWLEGGPGSSSTWAMFNVNGPCTIRDDLNGTVYNPNSWTNNANVIWLDQPIGVGFSYGDAADDDSDEVDVGRNVYAFLQGWLKNHSKFQSHQLFIAGQSYGGHYVPAAANYIVNQQKKPLANDTLRINLAGIAIGNGCTDTVVQLPGVVDMVESIRDEYNITLVTPDELKQMKQDAAVLAGIVQACQDPAQSQACLAITPALGKVLVPLITNPTRSPYDVRVVCTGPTCADEGMIKTEAYLNLNTTQSLLGVNKTFRWNNATVNREFAVDSGKSAVHFVPDILAANVRVLLFAGDTDLVCDWKGNDAWAKKLQWSGHDAYNAASVAPLQVDGQNAGEVRSAAGLTFVRVFNSGHTVPVDQPRVGLAIINSFFQNTTL